MSAKNMACAIIALAAGCSGGEGVTATGKVTIEGEAATGGRLSIVPVGKGVRGESLVAEDGSFAFRSQGAPGALPGSYHVVYTRSLGADGRTFRAGINQASTDEQSVIYQSPPDRPLVIPEDGAEQLTVDIRKVLGWTRDVSE